MDTNDFLGSFADENVTFQTQVIREATLGDNFWKVMIFVENNRFVDASSDAWTLIPGSATVKALTVTSTDYAEYTSGVLQSWLYDLFVSGFTGDCILVACGDISTEETPSADSFIETMEEAYAIMKPYAYHKTACANPVLSAEVESFTVNPEVAVSLAQLCAADKNLLSSAPYFPYSTATPTTPASDPLYSALKEVSADAFMSAHQDTTRNAALFSLGQALAVVNGSGTSVGNQVDMIKTGNITSSGTDGATLSKADRAILNALNIQTWKPVGNNTGYVAAEGGTTLNGETVSANWIISYITYMVKVRVAELITTRGFLKNESSYGSIVSVLTYYLGLFSTAGAGILNPLYLTVPKFEQVKGLSSSEEIIIQNAWSAYYVDNVRKVSITGALYIGA